MSRISSNNKDLREVLDEDSVYRAIKVHKLGQMEGLTIKQIEAVFHAYYEILLVCMRQDIKVNLPYLGTFFKKNRKGFKGGTIVVPKKGTAFTENEERIEKYIEPKEDFASIEFKLRPRVRESFKRETRGNV